MPLAKGEYSATLDAFMMSTDIYTLKINIEKRKRAMDFLMAHDQLQEVGTAEFEYSMGNDIMSTVKEIVSSVGEKLFNTGLKLHSQFDV